MVEGAVLKKIERFVDALKKEGIGVERVIVYGSYAGGRQTEDSDIDIAIVSGDFGNDPVEEGMRLFKIAGAIDSRIEPIPISVESFEKDTWLPLIYEIREKGIEVYANDIVS
jgi:uncharacterized protein